jgi:hypothetical protein
MMGDSFCGWIETLRPFWMSDRTRSSRLMSMKRSSAMLFRRSGTSPPRAISAAPALTTAGGHKFQRNEGQRHQKKKKARIKTPLTVPVTVQSEMTACAAVLGLSGALFPFLFRGVFGFVLLTYLDRLRIRERQQDVEDPHLEQLALDVLCASRPLFVRLDRSRATRRLRSET